MEVSSALPCKGYTPWQGLLLTASLLTCWILPTTAQVDIESLPPQVVEGENVLLRVDNLPENLLAFVWYKGVTDMSLGIALYSLAYSVSVTGPAHSGRETLYSNGSLWIQNVTQEDTGFYTLRTISKRGEIVSNTSTHLLVYSSILTCGRPPTSAQLSIESVPPSVAKGENVLLFVHNLPENLRAIFWYKGAIVFKDLEVARYVIAKNSSVLGPAHSGRETMYSNGSLLLQNVTQNDAGFYTLRTLSTDLKSEVVHVQLHVDTCLLIYAGLPTSAQLTVESVPTSVAEGASVLLLVHNLPENLRAIFWYKGAIVFKDLEVARYMIAKNSSVPGPAHSGRETMYSNGSLLIQNVTRNDVGFYTLWTLSTDLKAKAEHVQLQVDTSLSTCCDPLTSAPLRIDPVPRHAAKGGSVLLQVHNLPEDLRMFSWFKSVYSTQIFKIAEYSRAFNSIIRGPAYSRRETVYTNGSLLLRDATDKDSGMYTLQTIDRNFKIETAHVKVQINACVHPSTTGRLVIESVPPNVVEGRDVLLLVHNIPENLRSFSWYKGVAIVSRHEISRNIITSNRSRLGPAHSGRETVYSNGSLLLHNATQKDAGLYTLLTLNRQFETQGIHVHIHIYKPVMQPFIRVTDATVRVQSFVVLTCLSADTGISTQWLFNNQNLWLTERMTLSPSKCQLTIDPVTREDAGQYQCKVSNPVSSKTSLPVSLAVIIE
ncbi:carcinoembryonic antigen-related cell adhesion molecule 3-like isoform X1 [Apodemus sylvaticus]|uniref:carcinoembryonic antigen-related cell adhesion molecule 3-like isoform X1 n=1 Tax=Apodemus sylvaticus TaxID=10129 RepID=UPI00224238CC|nr:carcinoembryonic antigen-related cell adhesion molecule 3-like isoform X1 [Apodemus sylvaticus]